MAGKSFSSSRRLGQARAQEYQIVSGFPHGYRNREDITNLPSNTLVVGSQNVLTDVSGRIGIRKGYTLDGALDTSLSGIQATFDWRRSFGDTKHLRAGFLTSAGGNGKIQFRDVDSTGAVTWTDLITGLNSVNFNFATFFDALTEKTDFLLMVNGGSNIWEWSGATAHVESATNTSGTISELSAGKVGGSGYNLGDVLTVTGGGGTGGTFTVTQIANGAMDTFSIRAAGTGYVMGGTLIIPANGVGATVLIDSVDGSGGITGVSLLTQGSGYTAGVGPYSVGGTGTGAIIQVDSVVNGVVTGIQMLTQGSGYSITTAAATSGGAGTGATVNIVSVTTGGTITLEESQTPGQLGFYVSGVPAQVMIGGALYNYQAVGNNTLIGVTPDPSALVQGTLIFQAPRNTLNSAMSTLPATFNNDLIANFGNQIVIASLTNNVMYMSKINDYKDYSQANPRAPGDGFTFPALDGPPVSLIAQEQDLYVSSGKDNWYDIQTQLSADLTAQTVTVNKLKTASQQATQSQGLTQKIADSVVFVSNEPIVSTLGRVSNVVLTPQITDISNPIINDMVSYDFTDGSTASWRNYIFVSIPKQSIVRVYNMTNPKNPYWEAPLIMPIKCFSIIDGELYGHDYYVSQSYKLFNGYNDNGNAVSAVAKLAFNQNGEQQRGSLKHFNLFYVEGYISSNTTLNLGFQYDYDGFATTTTWPINGTDSIVANSSTLNSLGKSSLGKLPLGSNITADPAPGTTTLPAKFRGVKQTAYVPFYEYSVSFSSEGTNQQWQILAFGPYMTSTDEIGVGIRF